MNDSTTVDRAKDLGLAALAIAAAIIVVTLPFLSQLALPSGPGPTMDPNFRIPALPVDSPYYPFYTNVSMAVMLVMFVGGIVYSIPDALKRKTLVPVMVALSGIGLCIPEVYFDVMGSVWFPVSADNNAFTIIGRQMSWAIVASWAGFSGPFLVLCYVQFRKGASNRMLWGVFLAAGILSMPVEEVMLHFGQYYYYGNQPLILFAKYPYWWMPCNAGGIFLAAALIYRLEPLLQGWRSLAILLITPMSVAGLYGFIALPAFIAVNGNYGRLVTHAAGLLTILMGVAAVALIIRFVIRGTPINAEQH